MAKEEEDRPRRKYGGYVGDPDLGANGRRLYAYLVDTEGKERAAEILKSAREMAIARPNERFIRWTDLAKEAGIDDAEAKRLVAKLFRLHGAQAGLANGTL